MSIDQILHDAAADVQAASRSIQTRKVSTVKVRSRKQTVISLSVGVVLIIGIGVFARGLLPGGVSPAESDDGPAATLEKFVTEYNAGDIDGVMELFSEESVMIAYDGTYTGLTAIRSWHVNDLESAASEDAYTFSAIKVTGTAVTWDQTWAATGGDEFCYAGQSAVVEDGIILSWTWSGSTPNC